MRKFLDDEKMFTTCGETILSTPKISCSFCTLPAVTLRGNPCVICHHFHRLRHPGTQAPSLMDTLRTLNKLGPRITARVLDRER